MPLCPDHAPITEATRGHATAMKTLLLTRKCPYAPIFFLIREAKKEERRWGKRYCCSGKSSGHRGIGASMKHKDTMSRIEHYSVTCLCNATVTSPTREMTCPGCGLTITVEWPCVTRIEANNGSPTA